MKNLIALIVGVSLTALIGLVDVSFAAGTNKDQKPDDKAMAESWNSSRSNVSNARGSGVKEGDKAMAKNYSSSRSNNGKGRSNPGDEKERKKKGDNR